MCRYSESSLKEPILCSGHVLAQEKGNENELASDKELV